jgi:hypothetical protein
MRRRQFGVGAAALALATVGALAGAGGAQAAAGPVTYGQRETLAHGVDYQEITVAATAGTVHGHVVPVDLRDPHIRVDLLAPGAVAARAAVSQMAGSGGAVAAVNGDFFDIDESQHPGVTPTGSSVGPEIASGRALKAAVPGAQRFGPALPKAPEGTPHHSPLYRSWVRRLSCSPRTDPTGADRRGPL